ncbi:MAG: nucleotidyltransferase domain-containing protein [Rhizobiales bacterium]|nr:nucleotidyltransferase domain-containing protein [Hyphomicrobiales bacterium]
MKIEMALKTLRGHEVELRARGVRHAALFGSVARMEDRPESDVDVVIDFDPEAKLTVFDYVGLKDYIGSIFDAKVDVVDREAVKPDVRRAVERDAVYAF